MTEPTHFDSRSIAYGLHLGEFNDLPKKYKKRLVRLMARLAEKSYRRGFQHGIVIGNRRVIEPEVLRFERSLDWSPYTDHPSLKDSAVVRLFMENGELRNIGFVLQAP